jgi:hypothetical protein
VTHQRIDNTRALKVGRLSIDGEGDTADDVGDTADGDCDVCDVWQRPRRV